MNQSDQPETESMTFDEARQIIARFERGQLRDEERPRLWEARSMLQSSDRARPYN